MVEKSWHEEVRKFGERLEERLTERLEKRLKAWADEELGTWRLQIAAQSAHAQDHNARILALEEGSDIKVQSVFRPMEFHNTRRSGPADRRYRNLVDCGKYRRDDTGGRRAGDEKNVYFMRGVDNNGQRSSDHSR